MKANRIMCSMAIASCLLLTVTSFAQPPQRPLTNTEVIRMVKDGVPESSILESIRSRPGTFDLSNTARSALFAAGGKDRAGDMTKIWDAMIAKATNGRGGDDDDSKPQSSAPRGTLMAPGQTTLLGSQAKSGSGNTVRKTDDLNPQPPPSAGKTIDLQLAEKLGAAHAGPVVKNPRAVHANAAIIAVLQKQRSATDIEATQMKLSLRPAAFGGVSGGQSQLMSASGTGGASGTAGNLATATLPQPSGGNSGPANGGNSGVSTGGSGSGKILSSMAQLHSFNNIALTCANNPTFRILNVSGSMAPATFTPIDQYNLYTISGCSFGNPGANDKVYIYGTGSFQANFAIKFWSDNSIVVSLDETISGFPDLDNITLVVQRHDQQQTQKPGFKFYAARQTVPLKQMPSSWAQLAKIWTDSNSFPAQYSSPPASAPGPGPGAGTSYVSRFFNGQKFYILAVEPESDYYDFSQLAQGWTTDSFAVTTYDQNCPWVVTYREAFGVWRWNWDTNNPNNIRIWLSETTCSGFFAPMPLNNYQNLSGSYYALQVWVNGPRGIDPLTGQAGP